jgi:hypothetical protein
MFQAAVGDCRRLCDALHIPLGGADDRGQPTFKGDLIRFNGHVDSGNRISVQAADGLVWPVEGAHGIAAAGKVDAVAGGWYAGPAASARVLGPDGDGSYEAFSIERIFEPRYYRDQETQDWCSGFCKTNCRPYDLCVQGCLIVLSHHLGSDQFRVSSDGYSHEWNDARQACQYILGYGIAWGDGKLAPVASSKPG